MISRCLKYSEDSLTSTVFSQLLHLPIESFWSVLRNACFDAALPLICGEPEEVIFWPSWESENTNNVRRVEPDLFIRFAQFDFIIEAKRWDHGMQKRDQWVQEIQAYVNEYGAEQKTVFFLALGGLHNYKTEMLHVPSPHGGKCLVLKAQWERLLQSAMRQRAAFEKIPFPDSSCESKLRILSDAIDLFAHHGFSTGRWYEDLPFYLHRISPITHKLSFQ